jgi:HK97 family phage prohead protease
LSNLEQRAFEIRDINVDAREVSGIAVPYETEANGEMFVQGAAIPADVTMLYWEHDDPIGKVTSWEQRPEGLWITARFTEGVSQADETYALVKDGVINSFSIGFRMVESYRDPTSGVTVVTKADVREVSCVPMPWYETAVIEQVRESAPLETEETMQENTPAVTPEDLDEVRELAENLERQLAVIQTAPAEVAVDTRSAGEVLKAIASGDENELRTYTGGTTADSVLINGWVGDLTRIVDQAAILRGVFASGTLPSAGNFIEYAVLEANSMSVGVQAAEGDDLAFGKISLTTETAPVKTFGGYTQLTRQEIERSSVNVLDHSLRAQAIEAGKALNLFMRNEFSTEVAAQVTAGNVVELAATPTYADWVAAAIDAAAKFDLQGLTLDALVVDKATFKSLLNVQGVDGRPVFLVSGAGVNNVGNLNVRGLSGDLASIPVVMDPFLDGEVAFVNRNALRFYGSSLVQLQLENTINLSKNFSVYTYAAVAHEIPAGIVPVVPA